jgi:hypothetical protein
VIGVRFAYGLRIAGPLVLGTTSLRWRRFAAFNALGALIWAASFAGLGAVLGTSAVALLHVLHRFGVELLLPVALLIALVGVAAWQRAAADVSSVAARERDATARQPGPSTVQTRTRRGRGAEPEPTDRKDPS